MIRILSIVILIVICAACDFECVVLPSGQGYTSIPILSSGSLSYHVNANSKVDVYAVDTAYNVSKWSREYYKTLSILNNNDSYLPHTEYDLGDVKLQLIIQSNSFWYTNKVCYEYVNEPRSLVVNTPSGVTTVTWVFYALILGLSAIICIGIGVCITASILLYKRTPDTLSTRSLLINAEDNTI